MTIKINFTEKDANQVENRFNNNVVERIKNQIKTKNGTLQWKKNVDECNQRFYTVIKKGGYIFPIIRFEFHTNTYRCLLCWIEEHEQFEFIRIIEKEEHYPGSIQCRIEEHILKHPKEIAQKAQEKLQRKLEQNEQIIAE